MTQVLVRLLKRKTSLELDDSSSFMKTEFTKYDGTPDLSLSVYQLDELLGNPLVCTCAEHTAGNELNPQMRGCLNVAGINSFSVVTSPTQNRLFNFRFSSKSHREIILEDETALGEFAQQLVLTLRSRQRDVLARDVVDYAYQKYLTKDSEWQEVCKLSDKVRKWVLRGREDHK